MKKSTSYKKVFKDCSAELCDAIVAYEKPGYKPRFGECIEICFLEQHAKSSAVLTKQSAEKLYNHLKKLIEASEKVSL